jgi:hypothetical protein
MLTIKGYRTVIFAVILAILGAAQVLLPNLQGVITPELYGYITFGIGVMIAGLRAVTTTPLGKRDTQ